MSLLTNLVAYWKLDESSGNAADATGNGYTLTNNGSATYAAGLINNAASFNGSAQYLSYANFSAVVASSPVTINGWMYVTGTNQIMFGLRSTDTNDAQCYIYWAPGNPLVEFRYRGANGVSSSIELTSGLPSVGAWHMFTITFDGTTVTAYIDGVSKGTATGTTYMTYAGATLTLAKNGDYNATYGTGMIDEVGIWSRALTSTEITQLYNSGAGSQYPFTIASIPYILSSWIHWIF